MGYSYDQLTKMGATPGTNTNIAPKYSYDQLTKMGATPGTTSTEQSKESTIGGMVKGLVSAPLTMLARPVQAVAELSGVSDEDVNKFSNKISGGLIAPTPQNYGDVKKDVGRGIETVALGTGAPIATGAAFGFGNSLEQGNDVFSTQTLTNTLLGMGMGKALDLVGKPLLDTAGKVIGKITPQVLKNVVSHGSQYLSDFMTHHEILGSALKPLSEKITTGAENFDTGINNLFKGGKNKVGDIITSQYPGLSKDSQSKYYEKVDRENLMRPASTPGNKEAASIYKDAQNKGIDLGKVASDNKIYAQDLQNEGKWDTQDAVNALRKETIGDSNDLLRPALKEAEPGVKLLSIDEIKNTLKSKIQKLNTTEVSPTDKQAFLNSIDREYAQGGSEDLAHPNGYNLTDFHDNKILNSNKVTKGGYNTALNDVEKAKNIFYKNKSSVFKKLLEENAPKELDIQSFNKPLTARFQLADYLESLNGKKVPMSLFGKIAKTTGKITGAALGGTTGNILGSFGGYHAGGIAVDAFRNASNPIKAAYLKSIQKTEPEIFNAFREYVIKDQSVEGFNKLMQNRPQLKAGSKLDAELQKFKNKMGNIEMGQNVKPIDKIGNDFQQNKSIFENTKYLPNPEPRMIVPNNEGTPNQGIVYPGNKPVGGLRQRKGFFK